MSTHPLDVRTRELVSIYDLRPAAYHALAILPTSDARFWHHTPISQLLKIHDYEGNRGYHMICDIRHALLLDNELHSSNDNKGITEGTTQCADFPNNHMERTELVNRLFDAMVNLDDIRAFHSTISYQRCARWENLHAQPRREPAMLP